MSTVRDSAASFVALPPAEGGALGSHSGPAPSSGSGSSSAPAVPAAFWGAVHALLHPLPPRRRTADADGSDVKRLPGTQQAGTEETISQDQVRASVSRVLKLADAGFARHLSAPQEQEQLIARFFDSPLFAQHHAFTADLLVDIARHAKTLPTLLLSYEILLQYGAHDARVFRALQSRAAHMLPRLVHQVWAAHYAGLAQRQLEAGGASSAASGDVGMQIALREKAVRLAYEVCRVQRLDVADMRACDVKFINHLFDLVEETRHNADEAFNYQLIKLVVALNEQFMVSGLAPASSGPLSAGRTSPTSTRPTNLVMQVLQSRLNDSKTFGENLIFMLNRASSSDAEDLCMQLLVLKLLYLLFTTKETAHYFYTNDLKVLVDIFVRELSDLPDEAESLRHTYLRVLHPLLTGTQLLTHPYKRNEVRRLLLGLLSHAHLRDISATTRRLVERCLKAEWCVELDASATSPLAAHSVDADAPHMAVASVQSIMGGPTHDIVVETRIERGEEVIASEDSASRKRDVEIACAKEDACASSATTSSALGALVEPAVSPIVEASPHLHIAAAAGLEESDMGSVRLDVPRTRNKRMRSLSNLRSPSSSRDDEAAGSSTTLVRGPAGTSVERRVYSSHSMPPTPPRTASPASPESVDDAGDAPSSMHSSWHSHMVDVAPSSSTSRGPGPPRPPKSRADNGGASNAISSFGGSSPGQSVFLAHQLDAMPRLGSPLAYETTESFASLLPAGPDHLGAEMSLQRSRSSDSPSVRQTQSDILPSPAPKLHVRTASDVDEELQDEDATPTTSALRAGRGNGSGANGAQQRRRPPAPPAWDVPSLPVAGFPGNRRSSSSSEGSGSGGISGLPSSSGRGSPALEALRAARKEDASRAGRRELLQSPSDAAVAHALLPYVEGELDGRASPAPSNGSGTASPNPSARRRAPPPPPGSVYAVPASFAEPAVPRRPPPVNRATKGLRSALTGREEGHNTAQSPELSQQESGEKQLAELRLA